MTGFRPRINRKTLFTAAALGRIDPQTLKLCSQFDVAHGRIRIMRGVEISVLTPSANLVGIKSFTTASAAVRVE